MPRLSLTATNLAHLKIKDDAVPSDTLISDNQRVSRKFFFSLLEALKEMRALRLVRSVAAAFLLQSQPTPFQNLFVKG